MALTLTMPRNIVATHFDLQGSSWAGEPLSISWLQDDSDGVFSHTTEGSEKEEKEEAVLPARLASVVPIGSLGKEMLAVLCSGAQGRDISPAMVNISGVLPRHGCFP